MTQRAVKGDVSVPHGYILISDKWRNTELAELLKHKCKILYETDLGVVDFHPSNKVGVVYITGAELISQGAAYRKKLVRLRKADTCKGVVIAEKTDMSSQYYPQLQKFVMLELGLVLYPVTSQTETAIFLSQLVSVESKSESNPFLKRVESSVEETTQQFVLSLQTIPNLGIVKARQLLQHYGCLLSIAQASVEELSDIVGPSSAASLSHYFTHNQPP